MLQKFVIFFFKKIENKYLKDKKCHKVRDHCHYTGKYRGAVHSVCNVKYNVCKKVAVAFHNGDMVKHELPVASYEL